ncbi:septum formation initiator family protein [Candidatus Thioglobus sp.]|nr:septum formation initiator family protein [Candidatus Thioglobus sp.]MDB3893051.1 septum formation initiator family protein [Candidatus Thioglobus sp.]MDC0903997.1 septum formation initiator family protein [Candidatus Thioglobus sp.]MDC0920373.1 septum formation initiator family protein [Candidatus Thioglobus sp.]MDC0965728.1 septum formation initiator family protein [Candidatus Thioglobus sp.]
MNINSLKKPNKLFGFFYRYWISIILLVVLATLIRQNFIINTFPFDISEKQAILKENLAVNQQLKQENLKLKLELNAKSDEKLEILESMARQKFGLIKPGEKYYQISISDPD